MKKQVEERRQAEYAMARYLLTHASIPAKKKMRKFSRKQKQCMFEIARRTASNLLDNFTARR